MRAASAFTRSALIALVALSLTSCAQNKPKVDEGLPTSEAIENTMGDSDSGKAMGLQTIHFGYDAYTLDDTAKGILDSNAQILKDHGSLKIQIEGHCDQRGGIQYNIALGEKRANTVKHYLEGKGTGKDRVTTISFGKERPVDTGTTDEAYAKNRRANFSITSK
jgi:peptidoglycan-associated lipoprotein